MSSDFHGWWNRSLALIKSTWRPMALIQLASVIPVTVLTVAATLWADTVPNPFPTGTTSGEVDFDGNALGRLVAVFAPLILIAAALGVLINLATMQLLVQRATGQPVSIAAALRTCLSRALPMIGWGIVAGLTVLVGFLCCILPGIYVIAVVSILPAVVLLERGRGVGRCFQLFHGNLGDSLSRLLTIGAVSIGVTIVENVLDAVITLGGTSSVVLTVISAVVTGAFALATSVVTPALLLTTYADMRARLEPFSTAYLMPGTPPPPAPA